MLRTTVLSIAALGLLGATAALAQTPTFGSTPVDCGRGSKLRNCAAAFDGRTLTYTFTGEQGGFVTASYPNCQVTAQRIRCTGGTWFTNRGQTGANDGTRSITLSGGRPTGAGH